MVKEIFIIYLAIINVLTFFVYGNDKKRAIKHSYRIPENVLIRLAVFGGSFGAFLGMKIFHHKTLHRKFSIGIPIIMAVQILVIAMVLYFVLFRSQ